MSHTTMKVNRKTLDRLKSHGDFGETYEGVVNRLLDAADEEENEV